MAGSVERRAVEHLDEGDAFIDNVKDQIAVPPKLAVPGRPIAVSVHRVRLLGRRFCIEALTEVIVTGARLQDAQFVYLTRQAGFVVASERIPELAGKYRPPIDEPGRIFFHTGRLRSRSCVGPSQLPRASQLPDQARRDAVSDFWCEL